MYSSFKSPIRLSALSVAFFIDTMRALCSLAFAFLLATIATALAQTYPSRPITMIVPFPPGGLSDVVGRIAAEGMGAALGQSIVIENVGGATGSIGTGRVARAAPDGYTLALGIWNTHVANGVAYALPYDVVEDFEPIALLADAPLTQADILSTPDVSAVGGLIVAPTGAPLRRLARLRTPVPEVEAEEDLVTLE